MAGMRCALFGLVAVGVLAAPPAGQAQLSSPSPYPTLSERWAWHDTVVLAEWRSARQGLQDAPGSTTLEVIRVLKGGGDKLKPGDRVTFGEYLAGTNGMPCLLFRDAAVESWEYPLRGATEATIEHMTKAPQPNLAPPKRLPYFVRQLDSRDLEASQDSLHELAIAGTKHIAALSADDRRLLERHLTRPRTEEEEESARMGLDHLVAGYALATGEPGLDLIDEKLLRNPRTPFHDVYAVYKALQFLWLGIENPIGDERLQRSMRLLLDRPAIADFAIRDLAAWRDWSVQDRVMALYGTIGDDTNASKRAIIAYLVTSASDVPLGKVGEPPPRVVQAREHLAKLKAKDPQLFKEAPTPVPRSLRAADRPKGDRVETAAGIDTVASSISGISIYAHAIHTIAFTPDGKLLLSGDGGGITRWWDVATGKHVETVKAHSTWCFSIAFSRDGARLATGSGDRTIKIWDPATRRPILTLEGHADDVHAVAFDPAGRLVLSAGDDRTLKVFDVEKKSLVRTLEGHTEQIPCLAVSPDGTLVATGSRDDTVRLWEAATGKLRHLLKGHAGDVHSVAFSPDGKTLASASYDETVRLWDVASGEPRSTLREHANWVFSVAWGPDGRELASGDKDGRVVLWDAETGQPRGVLKRQRHVSCVAFSPDGKALAASAPDGSICLWDPQGMTLRTVLRPRPDDRVVEIPK
ncbi:MAG: WD40 repeat domain-containing protein [Planctomycetales bacterium]